MSKVLNWEDVVYFSLLCFQAATLRRISVVKLLTFPWRSAGSRRPPAWTRTPEQRWGWRCSYRSSVPRSAPGDVRERHVEDWWAAPSTHSNKAGNLHPLVQHSELWRSKVKLHWKIIMWTYCIAVFFFFYFLIQKKHLHLFNWLHKMTRIFLLCKYKIFLHVKPDL